MTDAKKKKIVSEEIEKFPAGRGLLKSPMKA